METQFRPSQGAMSTSTPMHGRAAERASILNDVAVKLFHADVLDGNTERSATWESTTDADRKHYRGRARRELRQSDTLALGSAMYRAKEAAFGALPAATRMFLMDNGRSDFDLAIEAAVKAHDDQLLHGKEEQEERRFEQIHDIPTPRDFTVIPGGQDNGLRCLSCCGRVKDSRCVRCGDEVTAEDQPQLAVESAQESEGEVTRAPMSPLAAGVFDALRAGADEQGGR